jgi:hypothetical protein
LFLVVVGNHAIQVRKRYKAWHRASQEARRFVRR